MPPGGLEFFNFFLSVPQKKEAAAASGAEPSDKEGGAEAKPKAKAKRKAKAAAAERGSTPPAVRTAAVCKFWANGQPCPKGDKCDKLHRLPKDVAPALNSGSESEKPRANSPGR